MHGLARFLTAILGSIYFHFAKFNTILIEFLFILVEFNISGIVRNISNYNINIQFSGYFKFFHNIYASFIAEIASNSSLAQIFSSESSEFLNSVQKVIHNSFIHFRQNGSSFVVPR